MNELYREQQRAVNRYYSDRLEYIATMPKMPPKSKWQKFVRRIQWHIEQWLDVVASWRRP